MDVKVRGYNKMDGGQMYTWIYTYVIGMHSYSLEELLCTSCSSSSSRVVTVSFPSSSFSSGSAAVASIDIFSESPVKTCLNGGVALVDHHPGYGEHFLRRAPNNRKHKGAGKQEPKPGHVPWNEEKKEQKFERRDRESFEHDEVVVRQTRVEGTGVTSGFDKAGVVLRIHVFNTCLVAGILNREGEDENDEDQIQEDEQEQSQVEHQQLLELSERNEEVSNPAQC